LASLSIIDWASVFHFAAQDTFLGGRRESDPFEVTCH
jgi:hypothetical protein